MQQQAEAAKEAGGIPLYWLYACPVVPVNSQAANVRHGAPGDHLTIRGGVDVHNQSKVIKETLSRFALCTRYE